MSGGNNKPDGLEVDADTLLLASWMARRETGETNVEPMPERQVTAVDQSSKAAAALDEQFGFKSVRLAVGIYDWLEIERQIEAFLKRERGSVRFDGSLFPESYVNHKAMLFLGCYQAAGERLPSSLLRLIGEQLGAQSFGTAGNPQVIKREAAETLARENPGMSAREIGRRVRLSASTITRSAWWRVLRK